MKKKFALCGIAALAIAVAVITACTNPADAANPFLERLFRTDGVHTHDWGAWSVTRSATCTTAGVETRTCALDASHQETKPIAINPDAHSWGNWVQTKAPTETADGAETRTCAFGPAHKQTRGITALNHTHIWGNWTQTTPPTCTEAGVETRFCSLNATHTETRPGAAAIGHDWGGWALTTAPTVTTSGIETRTCKHDAAHKETRIIPATGGPDHEHIWGAWSVTALAACTTAGEETRICSLDSAHKETHPLEPLGHSYGVWIQTTAPTCTAAGEDTRTCARDSSHKETRTGAAALGHDWGVWVVITAPTATKNGVETKTCKHDATHTEDQTIPATGIKADPIINWPTGLTATYGQTLSNIPLPGNGTGIPAGMFTWTTPNDSVGSAGAQSHNMTFTPTDTADYNTLTQNVNITVNKASITAANITITGPVKGATPVTTAATTDTDYTCGAVSWRPDENPFHGGEVYVATVTLTADSNYTFAMLNTATVNGQNANISNNTGAAVTLSHTFPETDTRTATGIAIKTQPNKLAYTHGDPLDLSGLAVTLTYDDATTEDVAAAGFTAKNITVNPAHGIDLIHSAHDGQPVTITYGNLTPLTTGNLTVNKAAGSFAAHIAINTTYTPTLTLAGLNAQLINGYAWVSPSTSLSVGNGQSFAATYTDPSGNFNPASGAITVNVAKATGAAVSAPTLNASAHNSVTINPVTALTGQSVEYARNSTNAAPLTGWQTVTTFNGLTQNTTYYIFARSVSNANYETGAASGSLIVTTPQAVSPDRIEYYWVDQHGSLVTTGGGTATIAPGTTLTITAQGAGYAVRQWHLNGKNTGHSGNTYNFSSTAAGKHIIGLFVEKDGNLYNTNITITVQ